jgi:hypothetical protein
MSRSTCAPVPTSDSARVVGTPSAFIASLATNSRRLLRITARPSAILLYGVAPAPCMMASASFVTLMQMVIRGCFSHA